LTVFLSSRLPFCRTSRLVPSFLLFGFSLRHCRLPDDFFVCLVRLRLCVVPLLFSWRAVVLSRFFKFLALPSFEQSFGFCSPRPRPPRLVSSDSVLFSGVSIQLPPPIRSSPKVLACQVPETVSGFLSEIRPSFPPSPGIWPVG